MTPKFHRVVEHPPDHEGVLLDAIEEEVPRSLHEGSL